MRSITSLLLLSLTLAGPPVLAQNADDETETGLNFESWSSAKSRYPSQTDCPRTAPNSLQGYVNLPSRCR
jgi:hypothetical protein